jgi:hypothetical protein
MKNRKTSHLTLVATSPSPSPAKLTALDRRYVSRTIEILAEILCEGDDKSAKVAACGICDLIFRDDGVDERFFAVRAAMAAEARRHGQTAIFVLRDIARNGDCETVRAVAHAAMIERGISP